MSKHASIRDQNPQVANQTSHEANSNTRNFKSRRQHDRKTRLAPGGQADDPQLSAKSKSTRNLNKSTSKGPHDGKLFSSKSVPEMDKPGGSLNGRQRRLNTRAAIARQHSNKQLGKEHTNMVEDTSEYDRLHLVTPSINVPVSERLLISRESWLQSLETPQWRLRTPDTPNLHIAPAASTTTHKRTKRTRTQSKQKGTSVTKHKRKNHRVRRHKGKKEDLDNSNRKRKTSLAMKIEEYRLNQQLGGEDETYMRRSATLPRLPPRSRYDESRDPYGLSQVIYENLRKGARGMRGLKGSIPYAVDMRAGKPISDEIMRKNEYQTEAVHSRECRKRLQEARTKRLKQHLDAIEGRRLVLIGRYENRQKERINSLHRQRDRYMAPIQEQQARDAIKNSRRNGVGKVIGLPRRSQLRI